MGGKLPKLLQPFLKRISDHFTILFSLSLDVTLDQPGSYQLHHWNGLPPSGPRMASFTLTSPVRN